MPDFRDVIPGTRASAGRVSLAELQAAMASGELTSAALTTFYLYRIDRLNPALHAVITVNLNAGAEAAASDAVRQDRGPRGPLEGIPVLVKDNIQVAGMPTTAGSPALLSAEPDDAFLVTRLRAAGAVIIGKANLSEWANFRSPHSTSGWSTLGGQTANPHALDRNPSGSSSGSAAGVAAALAPVAVGTETDGSIVCPASACGIVGLKPTSGLVSRHGIVPISPVQDTAGPMAACVADAAALLAVLAAADPQDPAASDDTDLAERAIAALGPATFTRVLDPAALDGARLGIWRAPSAAAGAATGAVLDMAVAKLRSVGAVVIDPVTLPQAGRIAEPEFTALRHEFKYGINAYLAHLAGLGFAGSLPRTLAELIDFNKRNADLVLSRFGQETFEAAEATGGDLADPGYLAARREATRLARAAISAPLAEHGIEAIVALTANPAGLTDYVLGDHDVFHTSGPAAVAGCPSITVPAGQVSGLPVGVSFFGPRWSEPRLIALAYAFEQATLARQAPALPASVALVGRTLPPPVRDNLASMDSWRRTDIPVLPGSGPGPRIHDTASGKLVLAAAGPVATLYACGITPYDATHIGHAFTYTAWDLLVRAWLDARPEILGDGPPPGGPPARYTVSYVQNVTDVDDPLLERAERDGEDWRELARREIQRYRGDMEALRILPPDHLIGAVEALPVIEEFTARLADRGALYDLDEDLYFAKAADPRFGALSGPGTACGYDPAEMADLAAQRGGDPGRPGKKDPLDALVWRAERPGEPAWDSRFGRGRPGWHVECAAIATEYLGPVFDVQAGGSDLVFPHHELSASHARVAFAPAEGVFARVYAHSGTVSYQGSKMSKSLGNLVFVSSLLAGGADPMALRVALLAHHYRSDWEWTEALLADADARLTRWRAALARTVAAASAGPEDAPSDAAAETLTGVRARMRDDLDAPGALAVIDRWADRLLADAPTRITPADVAGARLVRDTADALLGIRL